jgi:hypothetical protein
MKHRYPLTPIDRYLSWRREDGTHLDPWLRTHERLGANIANVWCIRRRWLPSLRRFGLGHHVAGLRA